MTDNSQYVILEDDDEEQIEFDVTDQNHNNQKLSHKNGKARPTEKVTLRA